jgi:hypothetical protein
MGVDNKGTVTRRATHEVVTSVTDDQTQVALPCKVHTSSDLILRLCHNDIASVEAASAGLRWVIGRQAGVIGCQWPEFSDGVDSSVMMLVL